MARSLSPLRYPGGKAKIYNKVKNLIEVNDYGDRTYVEPFAGGFGIGIALLSDGVVKKAILNDYDIHLYHFWYSILNNTDELLKLIRDTPITVEERANQKQIYKDQHSSIVEDGYATLFLNRVNFSGVLNGGPIGGLSQNGTYRIDCRFNKEEIATRVEAVAQFKSRIRLGKSDGSQLIIELAAESERKDFFNIDPPYVIKGSRLYKNYFKDQDHKDLGKVISDTLIKPPWIVTYDDCSLIREIYKGYTMKAYGIQHNVASCFTGKELVVTNIEEERFVW
jgi:DNA adenine methylase